MKKSQKSRTDTNIKRNNLAILSLNSHKTVSQRTKNEIGDKTRRRPVAFAHSYKGTKPALPNYGVGNSRKDSRLSPALTPDELGTRGPSYYAYRRQTSDIHQRESERRDS